MVLGCCGMASATCDVSVGARVQVDGLKARPELNGSFGTVESLNEANGRWNVTVDDMREPLALRLEALTLVQEFAGIVVGTRVRIAGVDKKPELNGKTGTVEGFQGDRCTVYVDAIREKVALKPDTLAIADAAPSASARSAAASDDVGRPVRVECDGVALKLTLTPKQMQKPFVDAVLRPYLKAYSKKKGIAEVDVKEVAQVTVDSEGQTQLQVLGDIHIFSAEQCLKGLEGDVDVEVHLKKDKPKAPQPKEAPKGPPKLPKDARVVIHGLTSKAGEALNGLRGRVQFFHDNKGRYDVLVDEGTREERIVSVKVDNLIDIGAHDL